MTVAEVCSRVLEKRKTEHLKERKQGIDNITVILSNLDEGISVIFQKFDIQNDIRYQIWIRRSENTPGWLMMRELIQSKSKDIDYLSNGIPLIPFKKLPYYKYDYPIHVKSLPRSMKGYNTIELRYICYDGEISDLSQALYKQGYEIEVYSK